jgi:hypothetical protein
MNNSLFWTSNAEMCFVHDKISHVAAAVYLAATAVVPFMPHQQDEKDMLFSSQSTSGKNS